MANKKPMKAKSNARGKQKYLHTEIEHFDITKHGGVVSLRGPRDGLLQ